MDLNVRAGGYLEGHRQNSVRLTAFRVGQEQNVLGLDAGVHSSFERGEGWLRLYRGDRGRKTRLPIIIYDQDGQGRMKICRKGQFEVGFHAGSPLQGCFQCG